MKGAAAMAETTTTPEATPEGDESTETKPTETKETPSSTTVTPEEQAVIDAAENPKAVERLITSEREARRAADTAAAEAKAAADKATAKVQEFENAKKTDQEKLADERDELKTKATEANEKAATAEADALRVRVALEKKLPAELIDRLRGTTKEELEADADALLKLVKPAEAVDFDGGIRKPAPADVTPGLGRLAHAYADSGKK
jgi:hypothetical protein